MESAYSDQYIVVELGKEKYAFSIADINEIIKTQKITELPGSKPFLVGVTNLRGKIMPVVSLRRRFGLGGPEDTENSRIVVVRHRDEMIGILVDGVSHVTHFHEIQPATDVISGLDGQFLTGIGRTEDAFFGILHIEHILAGMSE